MLVKLIKWLFGKIKCNSSCSYNIENEIFNSNVMEDKLSTYDLSLKDIKKVYKILNRREKSIIPSSSTLSSDYNMNVRSISI